MILLSPGFAIFDVSEDIAISPALYQFGTALLAEIGGSIFWRA
jgi:hypothetical protein